MPTTLPERKSAGGGPLLALVFLVAFFAAIFAIEILDPAPMDVSAAWVAAP